MLSRRHGDLRAPNRRCHVIVFTMHVNIGVYLNFAGEGPFSEQIATAAVRCEDASHWLLRGVAAIAACGISCLSASDRVDLVERQAEKWAKRG